MHLADLYRKQAEDIESFERTRQLVWDKLKSDHAKIIVAFGDRDNLPDDMRKKIDNEIADFSREWANETGIKHQAMIDQHQRQFDELANPEKPKQTSQPDREKTKQQLIAEQKAMLAKQQQNRQKKRGR